MKYLTFREVLMLHDAAITIYGGSKGIRDQRLIKSALARPRAEFEGHEAYSDVFSKAAVLLEGLAKNHGFIDGNKRTALAATAVFLKRNRFKLKTSSRELVKQVMLVANSLSSVEETAAWLRGNTEEV